MQPLLINILPRQHLPVGQPARRPEILPELSTGEDAKDVAIEYIKEYDSKIK